jgi:hypothetical protein
MRAGSEPIYMVYLFYTLRTQVKADGLVGHLNFCRDVIGKMKKSQA